MSRRQFLYVSGGGIAGITIGTLGLSSLVGGRSSGVSLADTAAGEELVKEMVGAQGTSGPAASPSAAELANRISTAPGTRPELTANDDFYRIDINTRPPVIDGATWRLSLGGLVDNRLNLTLDEIRALPSQSQVLTMQCISNRIGGDLTGTSRWTGVRFKDVLELAGVQEGAREIQIASVDGFYESVGLDEAMDERVMLVYDMNGVPLPIEHGFPLRIYLPNRYGMKQPKWIATMDVIGREGSGYWVERGWSAEAYAHTTAVVDTVSVELLEENADLETVPVGGIAWAGDRGISKVEVQVDEGPWLEAELRTPPLSSLTWVQWVYAWPYETGRHVFRARAYDGSGQLQTVVPAPPRPDGATGIHEFFLRG